MRRTTETLVNGLGIFLVSALLAAACPTPARAALTIQDAVSIALQRNPTVKYSRERLVEGAEDAKYAFAQLFPTIGLTGTSQIEKDAVNVGNPQFGGDSYNYYSFGFTGTQPIYKGSALSAGIGFAKKDQELRKYALEIAERNLIVQVIQAFYTVRLNERQVEQYENDQRVQNTLLKEAYRRLKIGRSDKLEILQQETQLALLIPNLITARNTLEISAAQLAYLLEDRSAKRIECEGSLLPVNWQRYLKSVSTVSPHLPELEQIPVVEAQEKDKDDITMSPFWPSLNVVGTWGRSAYVKSDLLDDYSSAWTIGVQLSVPIFSGLSSLYERRALSSQEAQQAFQDQQTQDNLFVAQVQAKKNLDTAVDVIDPSKKAYDIGVQTLAQATKEYHLGITDYLTFFNAQTSYDLARFNYDQALYKLIAAQATYIAATGLPMDEYVKELGEPRQ